MFAILHSARQIIGYRDPIHIRIYLFIYGVFSDDFDSSENMVSNYMMTGEYWIGKHFEGVGCGNIPSSDKITKNLLGLQPRLDPTAPRKRSRIASHPIATFVERVSTYVRRIAKSRASSVNAVAVKCKI
jgi:hypothetical protein